MKRGRQAISLTAATLLASVITLITASQQPSTHAAVPSAVAQPSAPAASAGTTPSTRAADFYYVGADISWVQQREDAGTRYSDKGQVKDILAILKDHGFNAIRLRVFNDPTKATPEAGAKSRSKSRSKSKSKSEQEGAE